MNVDQTIASFNAYNLYLLLKQKSYLLYVKKGVKRMGPFLNPKDIQDYIEQMRKPLMEGQMNGEEIQKKILESIDQFLPPFLRGQSAPQNEKKSPDPAVNYQVFETHDFVIARIPIKQEEYFPPKLLMDTYHLYVNHLPDQKDLTIKLPSPIRPKNAKAEFKDGILEVRMLKRGPEPMTEISINDM